ncbi:MAG: energy transducer TonB [Sulfuricaulis sp.]|uniref:energy transducer TonB n=1 Tax=Sulfuricaulis sp. TaxID=2003553 RepID=UPI0025FC5CE0|nr:energy transducer TonB [Sulfuricaulis sp.]MCR4346819.1 energy transducer TonB [Sulfuricaulis sp.]
MIRPLHTVSLARFLLLSSGLHFIFLLGMDKSDGNLSLPDLGQRVLDVRIENSMHPLQTGPGKTSISQPPGQEANNILHAIHPETHLAFQPASSIVETARETEQETAAAMSTELRNQLLGKLQTRLSHYLVYPPQARKHGWEGTVLLRLRVESDGHLDKLRVERSSGYAVLDHSALNSLSRLGHLAGASLWLNGRGVDMQLPVIYRLVEN